MTPDSRQTAARSTEVLTLVAMCLGVMMTFLLITATISALSAIRDDLHVSPSALIWIPSAYTRWSWPAWCCRPARQAISWAASGCSASAWS